MLKEELEKLKLNQLYRIKSKLRYSIENSTNKEFKEVLESRLSYLETINDVINEKLKSINEDDGGGGDAGAGYANQGNVSGMGNVVSAQPSSTPGEAATGDGTVGSGDIGNPLGLFSKTPAKRKNKKKRGKKSRTYGNTTKGSKSSVMNYKDFIKDMTNKVNKVDEEYHSGGDGSKVWFEEIEVGQRFKTLKGEEWEKVSDTQAKSADESSEVDKGDIKFFKMGQLVIPLENK